MEGILGITVASCQRPKRVLAYHLFSEAKSSIEPTTMIAGIVFLLSEEIHVENNKFCSS
jgi:hypothetical protein